LIHFIIFSEGSKQKDFPFWRIKEYAQDAGKYAALKSGGTKRLNFYIVCDILKAETGLELIA
jgi:hypothetical protein